MFIYLFNRDIVIFFFILGDSSVHLIYFYIIAHGNFQNCATMNCQRNVNSILPTQLPHNFFYIVAILIHNHFDHSILMTKMMGNMSEILKSHTIFFFVETFRYWQLNF
jgi:hypothetical protein